jgi:lipid-binding SYLF domain-containing protein
MSKLSVLATLAIVAACGNKGPSSPQAAASLETQSNAALTDMFVRAPQLHAVVSDAAGYAVFPSIGAVGALVAGGASGHGVLYENGYPIGYVSMKQASIGPQLGGQTFSELIVLRTRDDVAAVRAGNFKFGAHASAVILNKGAAASTRFGSGQTVFVEPRGGMMASASLTGQTINFVPRG